MRQNGKSFSDNEVKEWEKEEGGGRETVSNEDDKNGDKEDYNDDDYDTVILR